MLIFLTVAWRIIIQPALLCRKIQPFVEKLTPGNLVMTRLMDVCMAFLLNKITIPVGILMVMQLTTTVGQAHSHTQRLAKHSHWLPATATWYGSPHGDGSDGGACGYGKLASTPYGTHVSAASPVLFRNGMGCGACYQVKCVDGGVCSQVPVRVVITDECPGGYCASGRTHFDMSGSAFGRLATAQNVAPTLLNEGLIHVLYRRVPCRYHGRDIAFEVNSGATSFWFSMSVRYESGDGDLSVVELMEGQAKVWRKMEQLWGAYWCLIGGPLRAPFSIRITSSSGSMLTALNAIPYNWAPGVTYTSTVNFP